MWTPTPALSGRRKPRPGPAGVCVRAPLGRVGQAGLPGAFWCASPSPAAAPCALLVDSALSGLGLPCLWLFLGFHFFFLFLFLLRPCSLCRSVFSNLGYPGTWRRVVLPLPPPLFFFFFLFFSLPPPRLLSCFSSLFRPSCFLLVCCFFFCLGVPVLRCFGWFVCPALWGVVVCVAVGLLAWQGPFCACAVSLVAPWLCLFCVCCCLSCGGVVVCFVFCLVLCGVPVLGLVLSPCCCPLFRLPGPLSWPVVVFSPGVRCCVALVVVCRAVWCCLRRVLLVVPCRLVRAGWCCVLLPVNAGCSLLGLVAGCGSLLACVVAVAPAWPRGLPPCCVLWFFVVPCSPVVCPVFCGAVLPCGAMLCRPAVRFLLLVVLGCVPSLSVRCCVALRTVLFGAGLVCAVVGASCCGVSLCVVVSPLPLCGLAVLIWCVVVSCCAVLCSVVPCRLVVPCCWGVLCVVLCCGCSFFL